MKCLKVFFIVAMLMALAMTLSASPTQEEVLTDDDKGSATENSDVALPETESPISLRGISRFLAQKPRVEMTCNNYPRVCRTKGSPGPDCCKKKCVNVLTDTLNCGKCGKKCKFSEICCEGKCVNPLSNKKHCGSCNNKCKKGSSCVYGMCSYA
ncbi:unnamed protein product [Ilex paraguariensis]|uniref:Stigma-specific STIG1-like protein 1 n=1 Tax=Ilex paraguariensis TaxID=185542 RepID=A0ABC8V0X7_9AQUA